MSESLAYLAGFIDGEGSIAIGVNLNQGRRRWYLRFSVHQIDPAPLILLTKEFGGSVRKKDRPGYRPMYEWVASSMDAYEAIQRIRPWLVVKAKEADLAIEFQEVLLARGTRRSQLLPEEEEQRESLYRRMREAKGESHEDEAALTPKRTPAKPKPPKKIRVKVEPIRSTGYDRTKKPSKEDLIAAYRDLGLNQSAIRYGVSRQTVYNWLDAYGIARVGRTEETERRRIAAVKAFYR